MAQIHKTLQLSQEWFTPALQEGAALPNLDHREVPPRLRSRPISINGLVLAYQQCSLGLAPNPPPRADQLVNNLPRTDALSRALREARLGGAKCVQSLASLRLATWQFNKTTEQGDLLEMLLSLKSHGAWNGILNVVETTGAAYRGKPSSDVLEIQAMALNRAGFSQKARQVIYDLVLQRGYDSETLGMLGRVYKDQWMRTLQSTEKRKWLRRAIRAYLHGAICNPAEIYPLVNAMTLMVCDDGSYPELMRHRIVQLLIDRFQSGWADYFDFATSLEVAILLSQWDAAEKLMSLISRVGGEAWELQTTSNNLALLASSAALKDSSDHIMSYVWALRWLTPTPRADFIQPRLNQEQLAAAQQAVLQLDGASSRHARLSYPMWSESNERFRASCGSTRR